MGVIHKAVAFYCVEPFHPSKSRTRLVMLVCFIVNSELLQCVHQAVHLLHLWENFINDHLYVPSVVCCATDQLRIMKRFPICVFLPHPPYTVELCVIKCVEIQIRLGDFSTAQQGNHPTEFESLHILWHRAQQWPLYGQKYLNFSPICIYNSIN